MAALGFGFAIGHGQLFATNHDLHMDELMAGANGNSRIQFIVVRRHFSGQNQWGPNGAPQSRAMLVFFDAVGREIGKFKFPSNPADNSSLRTLIATAEFAALPGAPTPDFIIPPLMNAISGKVCFRNNPANFSAFVINQCISYGSFLGSTDTPDGPTVALPIVDTSSLRVKSTVSGPQRNDHYELVSVPTPRNTATPFTIPVASQVVQGGTLFNQETFQGNGRSCGSCHVSSLSFGLPPSNIASRFLGLTTTFDPQFIGEVAPSGFDSGFDFNLNTLVLTAEVSTAAPCTGELRGIITSSGGARGKVLTRISATTYLVYGGRSPAFSGTITDGVCSGTFQSITAGGLAVPAGQVSPAGLEDPRKMRSSSHSTFPQGRALILENVDGVSPLSAHVFRKSPHLLNLSRTAPHGFSGDVPDLQTFVTGAVTQHFPRTLARSNIGSAPDFRFPTAAERAAMEAFMLAQEFPAGSDSNKFDLSRFVTTSAEQRGQTAFFGAAKCSQCHGGTVLAATTVSIQGKGVGVNAAFNTGVVNREINASFFDNLPPERQGGTGAAGSREFSTPQLFNVKNVGPYFHDNSAATLREAIDFYATAAFNNSPAGLAIGGISINSATVDDILAFLEALSPTIADGGTISAATSTTLSGTAGSPVSPAPSVLVVDTLGAPLSGRTVTFAITGGGGSLTGAAQTTNSSGNATVGSWTLGAGTNTMTASVAGSFTGSPVTFTATGNAPNNDNFSNRTVLTGSTVITTGTNVGFSTEGGEPSDLINGGSGTPSTWWTWTPACSFTVSATGALMNTNGSSFDTVLGLFTGSAVGSLTRIASDDDSGDGVDSAIPSSFPGPASISVAAGTPLQIRVRGFSPGSTGSIQLNITAPACAPFTDPSLMSGVTTIRREHVIQLRDRINSARLAAGLPAFSWTDPELTGAMIRTVHFTEMRSALLAVYSARGLPAPAFTDSSLTARGTFVRAVHVQELRSAVLGVE